MRGKNLYGACIRPTAAVKKAQKRKKSDAAKVKKAQTLLKQAYNQIKDVYGLAEIDMGKHGIQYAHSQLSAGTKWLDGTEKEPLGPVVDTEVEFQEHDFEQIRRPRNALQ